MRIIKTSYALLMLFVCFGISGYAQEIIKTNDKIRNRAMKNLISEANQGNAESQYVIARHCLKGEFIKKDEHIAFLYLCKSARQNYAPAQYDLGCLLSDDNIEESARLIKNSIVNYTAADSCYFDIEDACTMLWNIATDFVFEKSEDKTYDGLIKKMTPKALELFEFIATQNDNDAIELLMQYYYTHSVYDEEEHCDKFLEYAQQGYSQRIPSSGFYLGEIYYFGLGVQEDWHKAIRFYEYGTNDKDSNDQICRARLSEICYEKKNMIDKAFKYSYDYAFNSVHDDFDYAVFHRLASCYRFGRGVQQNIIMAEMWELLGLWHGDSDSEHIAETRYNVNSDNDIDVITFLTKQMHSYITDADVDNYATSAIIRGIYYTSVLKTVEGLNFLISAYNNPTASEYDRVICAYLLKGVQNEIPSVLSEDAIEIISSFEQREGISFDDVFDEESNIVENCLLKLWLEQIHIFEIKGIKLKSSV